MSEDKFDGMMLVVVITLISGLIMFFLSGGVGLEDKTICRDPLCPTLQEKQ